MRPYIIHELENQYIQEHSNLQTIFNQIRSGDIVQVNYKASSTKAKKSLFVGVCISKRQKGLSSSLTIRNYVMGEAVEYTFFPYSNNVDELKIVQDTKPKVKFRRAKLYYLRKRTPKESTVTA